MPYLGAFILKSEKKSLLFLRSPPRIRQNAKILGKQKKIQIGDQKCLFEYFWAVILKYHCHL